MSGNGVTAAEPKFYSGSHLAARCLDSRYPNPRHGLLDFLRVNPPIHQALAADILQHLSGSVGIVEANRLAGIPAEVEFSGITLQVLLADAVKRAIQTSLEATRNTTFRVKPFPAAPASTWHCAGHP